MEEWRDVPEYEGDYQVSNLGRVRSVHKIIVKSNGQKYTRVSKMLKPAVNLDGYSKCALSKAGKLKCFAVHRLVAKAFVNGEQAGFEVDHVNGQRSDNRPENLRWMNKTAHLKDSWERGQMIGSVHYGESNGWSKYSKELIAQAKMEVAQWKKNGRERGGLKKISERLGVHRDTIKDISRGRAWRWLDAM